MNDILQKVKPGDSLRIPARTYNAFVDAAIDYQRRTQARHQTPANRTMTGNSGAALRNGVVLVRNDSDIPCDRFHVLGLGDPIILATDNEAAFLDRIAFAGVVPTLTDHAQTSRYAVLLEPLPAGSLGRAIIHGITQARVRVEDPAHRYATISDGDTTALVTAPAGAAQLLWLDPTVPVGEIAWAVVRLGSPIVALDTLIPCRVWRDGGTTDGDKNVPCDRTYLARSLDATSPTTGVLLGENLTPEKRRPAKGKLSTPAATGEGVVGTGYHTIAEGELVFRLYDANETLDVEVCT